MSDGKQEVKIQHKWLWAISPLNSFDFIAFVGHCRLCNLTYTERLVVGDSTHPMMVPVALPEWGCNPSPTLL